jgi:hypothetical protein
MEPNRRPPPLSLSPSSPARPISSSPSPQHRQSQSPFRYVQLHPGTEDIDEKATPLIDFPSDTQRQARPGPSYSQQKATSPPTSSRTDRRYQSRSERPSRIALSSPSASPLLRQPTPSLAFSRPLPQTSSSYTRPRGLRIANLIKPWIPIILYGITSLAFIIAIAVNKTEVFTRALIFQILSHVLSTLLFRPRSTVPLAAKR